MIFLNLIKAVYNYLCRSDKLEWASRTPKSHDTDYAKVKAIDKMVRLK